jgi:N-acetylmuramate 1-kinase
VTSPAPATDRLATRESAARAWISTCHPGRPWTLTSASADASFRRYFRVNFADDGSSTILMDAPPDKEDCKPFIAVAELFAAAGVNVPQVLAHDLNQGFLMLTDLGSTTYLSALNDDSADRLYRDAIAALIAIQAQSRPGVLPDYDRALLSRELDLFPEWFVARQSAVELTPAERAIVAQTFEKLVANNLAQPKVYVHRDYHSRNLMVTTSNPGILDFQDAVYGPITYDLVSLLRDAYINWPEAQVLDWAIRYWETARKAGLPVAADFGDFYRDFEWMGVQRQIKVVGIFARLCYRDGKTQYLADQPRVMKYLHTTCKRYNGLGEFARLLDRLITTMQ